MLSVEEVKKVMRIEHSLITQFTSPSGPFTVSEKIFSNGRKLRYYEKGIQTIPELFQEGFKNHSKNIFLNVDGREKYTYAEVFALCNALGFVLHSKFDVRKGDRVAIIMRNCAEWCIGYTACFLIGAIPIPINSHWTIPELNYGLSDCVPKLLLCDLECLRRSIPHLRVRPDLHCILAQESHVPENLDPTVLQRVHPWHHVIKAGVGQSLPPVKVVPEDIAEILYTSGSTGVPKGVVLTHLNLATMMNTSGVVLKVVQTMGLPLPNSILLTVPLFHVTGLHHVFLLSFWSGSSIVLMPKWSSKRALQLIQTEGVSTFTGVPTMIQDLLEDPELEKFDVSSLLSVGYGGSPCPPSQVGKVKGKLPKIVVRQGYGMTELSGGVASIFGVQYLWKPESTGIPSMMVDVKIINPDTGSEVEKGQAGEIFVKGAMVMKEYLNKPEETKKTIVELNGDPGWLRTGDIGKLDEDGFLYILDRVKDIIIRGGENIASTEVEAAFYQHPAVMECAAIPLPHPRLGEVVGLVVVLKPGHIVNAEDLTLSVKGKLSKYKIPDLASVFFTTEPLPRTATDKISKLKLKELVKRSKL